MAFYVAESKVEEAMQYLEELAPRRGIPDETWRTALSSIMAAVQIIPQVELSAAEHEAMARIGQRDPEDWPALAADLASAIRWVTRFVNWYNGTHRHSAIRYVTPDQRHLGRERAVLTRRHELYERMRQANPERWSGSTRNWLPVGTVVLNPERAHMARQLS